MAIGIHVVYLGPKHVSAAGVPVNKATATIGQMITASQDIRVIPDSGVANSANWPSIKEYLEAEAADNYVLGSLTQTMIVTYSATDINAA